MKKIILASNNKGKIAEFNTMLDGIYQVVSMSDMQVEEVPETGLTFVENALIKARNASEQSGLPALSDDSGIVVDALNGEPGIYSARYAGNHGDDEANTQKLLDKMEDVADGKRTARFWCAIVFVEHANDPTPIIIQRGWEGEILRKKAGDNGFGYDPIFYVPTHGCASAELSPEIKNSISHRGKALVALLEELKA
ncbi:MAG: RdgB/HAM1 family non-canonical purine NTP pyrophosphatase [Candidatus Thioglobus sp.]|jgi:XTP/dITP diphosphohydrolase|uniref:RdgB/HAM1 family non-canonical purine NTP pyrophosphatase n=1 Tax=Candidatus Thioglobus sp. TaxID=2026721 RepID=UPI001EC050A9|nr:RdgB/HAM1 family non-canonical purine NTP pyrophosphatase [Candidatus Thioglobus sp.]MBT3186734.1 RdgB/HAM1 family non-canonical purine NTP pyrophosphatase [Candidatus Thioglobus sp.]MBT3965295.1 RdgB/HAM1 family non-canonical purine NTP pyrophosphatase [Candidatus Thioglobus sp.]MBT4923937.1 RdgB/HAM1 family non-canonical purine NTP pyrophosphatase [Candidatus Thioglobus sp.]MBT5287190.1 RdgB/HAM1 family non-canonical purine NTP pyrophosphatase [Candidatus Thioglobus sp.]MBT7411843.1 RdgB/